MLGYMRSHSRRKQHTEWKSRNPNSSMIFSQYHTHVCISRTQTHTGVATLNNQRLFVSQWLPAARSGKTRRKQPALIKHRQQRRVYYTHKLCTRSYGWMWSSFFCQPFFLTSPACALTSLAHIILMQNCALTDLDWHVSIKAPRRSTVNIRTCCFVSCCDTHLANDVWHNYAAWWWRTDGGWIVRLDRWIWVMSKKCWANLLHAFQQAKNCVYLWHSEKRVNFLFNFQTKWSNSKKIICLYFHFYHLLNRFENNNRRC